MGRVVIHKLSNEELILKRQQDFLKLSFAQRFKKTIDLALVQNLFNPSKNKEGRNKIIIKD